LFTWSMIPKAVDTFNIQQNLVVIVHVSVHERF
jgi:hypothetical protein